MSTIYLIRHGKTEANEKRLYCGSTDLPLSAAGKQELRGIRYDIKNARFITSGMKRTEQTLDILFGAVEHTIDPRFREVDFGTFEMRGYDDLKHDPAYQAWISGDNDSNVPPNGESGEQMCKRALDAFQEVLQSGRDTVIVTHGGVIASIMKYCFPEANKSRYQWQPPNGCGYRICGSRYHAIPEVSIMVTTEEDKKAWAIQQLQAKAQELGRPPTKADFDGGTKARIKSFLGPWPRALETAGLKEPKQK